MYDTCVWQGCGNAAIAVMQLLTYRPGSMLKGVSYRQEDPDWLEREGKPPERRAGLPKPAQAEKSVSLWSIIKECVGKDLSRVCLPVYFNEPLSMLQRIAEELEYSQLLDKVQLQLGWIVSCWRLSALHSL